MTPQSHVTRRVCPPRFVMSEPQDNLPWLVSYDGDFKKACEDLAPGDSRGLTNLINHRLSESQLRQVIKATDKFEAIPQGFEPFRLAILGDANNDFIETALRASALRHRIWLDVHVDPLPA